MHRYEEDGDCTCPPIPPLRLAMMTEHLFGDYRIGGATAAGVKPLERIAGN